MKFLLLIGCLVAGALAGDVLYPAYGGVGVGAGGVGVGGFGSGAGVGVAGVGGVASGGAQAAKAKNFDGVMDRGAYQNAAQQWGNQGINNGRSNQEWANDVGRQNAKQQATNSDYGSQAGNWDRNNNAATRAADQAAANSWASNQWRDGHDQNRNLVDRLTSQGNNWYQGRRNNDDIDYAYDKKFNLRDSQKGGFEAAESDRAWAKDDVADRAASYDRNADKASSWANAADAQRADRKSAASQNAADSGSSWDKFARSSANAASANGRNNDWQQKLDESNGANRLWNDARKTASDVYKDLATADGSYNRNAKAVGGRGGDYDGNVYGYGLAGAGGYAAKPFYGYGDNGYAKAAGARDEARAWDAASKDGLRNVGEAATEDRTRASFLRNNWLQDTNKGFDRNQKAAADDKGFSDWSKQNAQAANKADAASAAAANQWNNDQGAQKFNEDAWAKDAERKRLSDHGQDKKVYKKWFNDNEKGGDNWERMKYDRDQDADAFGYDWDTKKDWANQASSSAWKDRADANGNDAKAARSSAAARQASQDDWRKDQQGWNNANAQAADRNAAWNDGEDQHNWKTEQGQEKWDNAAQNARQFDRDAGRANLNTGAVEAVGAGRGGLAGGVGLNGGFGAGAVGVGGGLGGGYGGYPGYGYGYPGYGSGYGGKY